MAKNHYRPAYHVSPPQGRLNDPNGMFLSGNNLHVHYQHDPVFPFAPKRTGWAHAVIPLAGEGALIPRHLPAAMEPGHAYDAHGCYSGCAVPLPRHLLAEHGVEERGREEHCTERSDVEKHDAARHAAQARVALFYTGNLKTDEGRVATQNLTLLEDPDGPLGGVYRRAEDNPMIATRPEGFTPHYRDPHVTLDPERPGAWRMVLGAQRGEGEGGVDSGEGAVTLYRSGNLKDWEYAGPMTFDTSEAAPGEAPDIVPGGYMWECPNLIRLTDQHTGEEMDVLVICPQGLDEVEEVLPENPDVMVTHYASTDQCGYLVGRLEGTTFHVTRGFSELDYGHEFYAPHLIPETPASALMLAWMGQPAQDDKPSLAEGWVHMLTCLRRLTLVDGWLHQEPLLPERLDAPDAFRITATLGERDLEKKLIDATGTTQVRLTYDAAARVLSVARRGGHLALDRGDGNAWDTRTFRVEPGPLEMIVDGAAVEVFAGATGVTASLQAFSAPGVGWQRP
ncbi:MULTISPECIES: glycoside hydrolase family 32 protein [unclassified Corynebacterium]|uniref:glycoside hydrolase family 32 protein n=1 Tax=unclassified Corynebacterium TaxID=2624378 RepID=UPI0029CA6B03|nr:MULTISPECIES: glycoside hydrolase family 32 protein [unclassified Corynebacterium]WPF66490.1 glycoside hydrolase family 32 protein [Corynebacterium sp. 22KM0430]WPF68979.1 glycoside hydrolase family 32 protein [Corynebacterium sp. 21KM1197]